MDFLSSLWNYLIAASPYLLFGLAIAGIMRAFVSVDSVKRFMGTGKKRDILWASILGVPLPLCSCSVIPTAVELRKSGASNAATSAFLISTPESGVDSIAVTYGLMDWPMTILRPIAAFLSGAVAGYLQLLFKNDFQPATEAAPHCHACHCENKEPERPSMARRLIDGLRYAFGTLLTDMSLWLLFGILAGALIDFLIPPHFFHQMGPTTSRLAILAVGIPLYICASASTPIAASMVIKGLSPGVALLFLLVGPATNISSIAVLQKYIGKKGVVLNLIAIVVVALGFSYLVDFLYATLWGTPVMKLGAGHEHGDSHSWWAITSAILFSGLLLRGAILDLKEKWTTRA